MNRRSFMHNRVHETRCIYIPFSITKLAPVVSLNDYIPEVNFEAFEMTQKNLSEPRRILLILCICKSHERTLPPAIVALPRK